jgi:hypothetical protein
MTADALGYVHPAHGASGDGAAAPSSSIRLANSATIQLSAIASPGGGTALRTRWMRRSVLVKVPSFSTKLAAGKITSANWPVSL